MMFKNVTFFILFLIIFSCVEPYQFIVKDDQNTLVVEAHISDKSYNETRNYPSDGRFFTVKLSKTNDVINERSKPVGGAIINLVTSYGAELRYVEVKAGLYELQNEEFKAEKGVKYKLIIFLGDDEVVESAWEELPKIESPPMGEISFTETEKQVYEVELGKQVIKTIKGITTNITIPQNNTHNTIYYRWNYTPQWIYKAPLSSSISHPGNKCWAMDKNYLNDYALQSDKVGGYTKDLFFIGTIRNERIFEQFSVLISQYSMHEKYYSFWKEMQQQAQGGVIFDSPPYNLQSNFSSTNNNRVSGYFGVVNEQAKRWYFKSSELSYHVFNTLRDDCLVVYGPGGPAPECLDCREYSNGTATNVKPAWWP